MGRVIEDELQGEFHPLVGMQKVGEFVKGKVEEITATRNGNPAVTLSLIDTNGSVQKFISKGNYAEAEVAEGDLVQVVGSNKNLKEKLPKLAVGEIVTITLQSIVPLPGGKKFKKYEVLVD